MTYTISKDRVIENAQNIYDMFVSNYGFSSVLALDMKTVLDSLRAAIAQQAEQGWQPIETAPTDGTSFLGRHGNKVREAYRVQRDDCEMWCFGGSSGAVEFAPYLKPTHWMPLPASPKE